MIFGNVKTIDLQLDNGNPIHCGIVHRSARSPRAPTPHQHVMLELLVSAGCDCEQACVYYTIDERDPTGQGGFATRGHAIPMQSSGVVWNALNGVYDHRFQAFIPGQSDHTIVRYYLSAFSPTLGEIRADEGKFYAYFVSCHQPPAWSGYGVIYHVFVDRFSQEADKSWNGENPLNEFLGGTLKGVTEHLDYLSWLGINTIYLSPVFPSPSYHGYDATDYFDIEPRIGTKADFRHLLDKAHGKQKHVLLGFVPNHWSNRHPTFQAAITDPRSCYRKWYTFNHYPDDYESFFGICSMPQINLRNGGARKHILEAALYRLDFGVDGYRLDYAIGPTPDFWADFRKMTHMTRPDCWIFGEVLDSPDAQLAFDGLLDGCLDLNLLEALRNTFAYGRWNATDLAAFLTRHQIFFPEGFSQPSFLDNHDTDRFLWAAGGDKRRLKLAALCQFTLSGAPLIYYGTEVGMSQKQGISRENEQFGVLEEARLPMLWGMEQDSDLLDFYRDLIQFRKSNPILTSGMWELLYATSEVIAYSRSDGKQKVAIVLNPTSDRESIDLPGNWDSPIFLTSPGPELSPSNNVTRVKLPPLSGLVCT